MREAGERLRHDRGRVHVHGPGQRRIAGGPELHGGHVDHVGEFRQRLDRPPVEQIAGDGLDARRLERGARRRIGEARDPNHALLRCRPFGQARQRRPHLAGNAEDENVAGKRRKVGDQLRRRLGHEIFERGDALEAVGQVRRAHAAFSGKAGVRRPAGAAGIGRMAAKSMSAATAKPGQASEPSEICPLSMIRRAGPAERL